MHTEQVIEVKNLYKKFKIGQPRTIADAIPFFISSNHKKHFSALNGINLQVIKGDKLGVIGPNGSGKTTLLQVLAGITNPTRGKVRVSGKVAALLGIGAGFHPELTGTENIYLSGSILGMSSKEIRNKYDEIVEFSGVKKFLDTPIKHYSSGMFLRLAFSVSVFLDWDILLLDEVLSVGDAEFQEQSMKKIERIIDGTKTMIYVSHNLDSVKRLCTKAVILNKGKIISSGNPDQIVAKYLKLQNA